MEKIPHPSDYFDYLTLRAVFTMVTIILIGLFISTVVVDARKLECVTNLANTKYTLTEIKELCGVKND